MSSWFKSFNKWGSGYTQTELDEAQDRSGLRFPPDLLDLLRDRRPVDGYDWVRDEEQIRRMLEWPLEGILFDVENSELWWPEWGEQPSTAPERAQVMTEVVRKVPKLIPLISHRFIPEEPYERGNPVFSVHQSDIIYYGSDLMNYFENELLSPRLFRLGPDIKYIRFWSELVERQDTEFVSGSDD